VHGRKKERGRQERRVTTREIEKKVWREKVRKCYEKGKNCSPR
jgi:hypothetical protein